MKEKKIKIIILAAAVVIVAIVGIYFFVKYQTFDYMEITDTYENSGTDNANYKYCMDGILRYSRDGVALLNNLGEEKWNQPCQMSNPIVEVRGDSVAVADKGGTSILVFEEKGLKGEIQTTRPIEKISVSAQGTVSAILKDEEVPLVMHYDAKGKILVKHEVSLSNTGYPVDVALSEDGNTLLVSYLYTEGNSIISKIAYYYFGDNDTEKENYLVYQTELKDAVVPVTVFLQKEISMLVADNALIFYEGSKKLKESTRVEIKNEIQNVAYSEELVAILVKNDKTGNYKLDVYNTKGKKLSSVDVDKEYAHMKVVENQIILYDGQMCSIFTKDGIHKYEGNMDENIMEIFPIGGLNKYMVINASGFHEAKLAN